MTWSAERRYLLGNVRGIRSIALAAAAVVVINVIAALWWTSEHSVREFVLGKRDRIAAAANAQGIDPRLLASVLYVAQRDTVSVLSMSLEQLVMGAWLSDPKNDVNLAGPLDLSIGLTQIKPSTTLQAMDVYLSTATPAKGWGSEKELRPLPPLGPEWALPKVNASRLESPFPRHPTKPEVVAMLFTDDGSLSIAAFILALYETQWRSADPAWDIARKPEITATLYQIGFARSHPHADPRANEFGEAVGRVYRSPWMQEHFGTATDAQPSRASE